jgi:hypothetical protein
VLPLVFRNRFEVEPAPFPLRDDLDDRFAVARHDDLIARLGEAGEFREAILRLFMETVVMRAR